MGGLGHATRSQKWRLETTTHDALPIGGFWWCCWSYKHIDTACSCRQRPDRKQWRTDGPWVGGQRYIFQHFLVYCKMFYMPRLITRCIKHWPPSVCPSVNLIFCFVHTVSSNAEARYWYIDVGIHSVRPSMYLPLCVRVWVYVPLPL